MSGESKIEWTKATYNPWRGCSKVSPGCAHCYMFRDQERFGNDPSVVVRCSDSTFFAPVRSKKWRDLPEGALVFTCSWSDWFHEDADPWRDEAWEVIRERPDLTWQILTKRPERIADHLPQWWGDADAEAPDNIWLGVSIENRRFVGRADVLRSVPAAVRFISAEPLLGPLLYDAQVWDRWKDGPPEALPDGRERVRLHAAWDDGYDGPQLDLTDIDWLIAGGESGPKHRPMREEWVRDLRDACRGRVLGHYHGRSICTGEHCSRHDGLVHDLPRTAFFFKQYGGARPGGDALLDGREWREFPAVAR